MNSSQHRSSTPRKRSVNKGLENIPSGILGSLALPWFILKAGIKAVPALKYALGIAGIAAALAITSTLTSKLDVLAVRTTLIAIMAMMFLMVLLALVAAVAAVSPGRLRAPALFFVWSVLLLVVTAATLTLSCLFFDYPKQLSVVGLQTAPSVATKKAILVDEHVQGLSDVDKRMGTKKDPRIIHLDLAEGAFVTVHASVASTGMGTAIPNNDIFVQKRMEITWLFDGKTNLSCPDRKAITDGKGKPTSIDVSNECTVFLEKGAHDLSLWTLVTAWWNREQRDALSEVRGDIRVVATTEHP